jgi:fluoride ion exporter CrcB/FEX
MLETRSLTEHRRFHAATVNIVLSVVLGLAAAAAGQWLGRLL